MSAFQICIQYWFPLRGSFTNHGQTCNDDLYTSKLWLIITFLSLLRLGSFLHHWKAILSLLDLVQEYIGFRQLDFTATIVCSIRFLIYLFRLILLLPSLVPLMGGAWAYIMGLLMVGHIFLYFGSLFFVCLPLQFCFAIVSLVPGCWRCCDGGCWWGACGCWVW